MARSGRSAQGGSLHLNYFLSLSLTMAKGNMLQGRARGSVGDVTFQVLKGQQIAKARNRMPANPRTTKQMTQRSLFVDAVKFYTRGTQNLFKFAFEGKKQTESDFNAFMRVNAKLGVNLSPEAFNDFTYPALGNWVMSQGSLALNKNFEWISDNDLFAFRGETYTGSALNNVGEASRVVMSNSGAMIGDIVTVVFIRALGSDVSNTPAIYPESRGPVNWNIMQFRIDPTSAEALPDGLATQVIQNRLSITINGESDVDICAATLVVSRNTSAGLKVSTSFLVGNAMADAAIEAAKQESYIGQVVSAWKATGDAILQGSLSE